MHYCLMYSLIGSNLIIQFYVRVLHTPLGYIHLGKYYSTEIEFQIYITIDLYNII